VKGFLPDLGRATDVATKEVTTVGRSNDDAPTQGKSTSFGAAPVRGGEPYHDGWDVDRAIERAVKRVVWVFKAVDAKAKNHAKLRAVMRVGDPEKGDEITDSAIAALLNGNPNPYQDAWSWRYMLSAQVDLSRRGAFVEIVRNRVGDPIELYLLPPGQTLPIPDPRTYVSGYRVDMGDGQKRTLAPEDVLWIGLPHPTNPYLRMTPLEAAGLSIEIDYYARLWNRNFMQNDGRPGGILTFQEELDDDDADELLSRFNRPGPAGAGRISLLDGVGESNFVDTSVNPRDAQYEKSRQLAKEETLIAFGTPESILGNASGRTFDNAEAERDIFWQETMQPHNALIGRGMHRLDPDVTHYLGWDYGDIPILDRDRRNREAYALTELAAEAISVDEYRALTGREPVGEDVLRVRVGEDPAPIVVNTPPDQAVADGTTPTDETPVPPEAAKALETKDAEWDVQYGELHVDAKAADQLRKDADRRLRRWEKSIQGQMVRFFGRQERVVLAKLTSKKSRDQIERRPDGDPTWQRKAIPPDSLFDSEGWNEQLRTDAAAWVEAVVEDFGDETMSALRTTSSPGGWGFDFHDERVTKRIEEQVNRIVGINDTTFDAIKATLAEGEQAGETIDELAARVKSVFADAVGARAETIARTEVVSAANSASLEAGFQAGVEKKVWLATPDTRTRDSHRKADGEIVAMDDTFDIGDSRLEYPGDPNGAAGDVINCRCTLIFDVGSVTA
jgi:HK97 family phage portal protein